MEYTPAAMMDMLVRLYDLPDVSSARKVLEEQGILVRRARPYEKHIVAAWVKEHFSPKWVSECEVAFSRQPVSCFIATRDKQICGFACSDVTAKGYLGPMGVAEANRTHGLGRVLLVDALMHLWNSGYAYGIIGGVGPVEFYEKAVGAIAIPDSSPALYQDILPG